MKIAVLSLADINNYGDVFFPYLFRQELLSRLPDAQVDLFTNTEWHCKLFQTKRYSRHGLSDYHAVILAGGETVHFWEDEESWENLYEEPADGRSISDIAFDWLTLEEPFKAYFSVGIHPNMCNHRELVLRLLCQLDYLSVRGELSKKILEGGIIPNDNYIRVIPDLGWLFPKYIESTAPSIILPQKPYMIFEMFYEFDEEIVLYAANTLKNFQRETGVEVVLLPIVQTKSKQKVSSWNDYYTLSKINEFAGGAFNLMPDGLDILEVGALLGNAKFYLGGSMHGAVTSLAYGHPAGNALIWTAPKLQELHGARMRADCFINHWGKLPDLLYRLNREAEEKMCCQYNHQYAKYMCYRLSQELDELCSQIAANVHKI